ncbi:MAG: DUF2809 domain-containing protein [Clostridia bacterium]|nr:DUF2809 domain-containing protein [Clostridia bacterium]
MKARTLRLIYGGASLLLLMALCLIEGTTGFLRATVGDFVVVLFLYTMARTVIPQKLRILPLLIFLFALSVEVLQAVDVVGLLGITNETVQIAVGSVFDWGDIVAYALGCAVAAGVDFVVARKR